MANGRAQDAPPRRLPSLAGVGRNLLSRHYKIWRKECHFERSHFSALLTFAHRARCAAAILLRPAALIVLRLPRFADTPLTPWSVWLAN